MRFQLFRPLLILILILASVSPRMILAGTAIKTITNFVYSSEASMTGSVAIPFSVYIGDDISSVASPVKSAYFTTTGIYTGSGSLAFMINGEAGSLKTYTLPNVGGTPTRFTVIYEDPTGIISPTTAGTFNYTLNVTATGVTISGLGIESTITYEFTQQSCPDGQSTNEKIKTTDTYVYASPSQMSGSVVTPVLLYIGDDITGIVNPVKSAYFTITGLYTSGGTFAFTLDGDAATTKTFNLPNVGSTPTRFSLKYKDDGKITPTTAGTYTYSLAMNPSGVTISGLGVVLTVTYRYKPPACGGFPATGELYSTTFDTTGAADGPAYNSILWKGALGGPSQNIGQVRFQLATSTNSGGPWNYVGGSTCTASDWFDPGAPDTPVELRCPSQFNENRYFRYKIQICSVNCVAAGVYTPQVDDVVVSWSP